MFNAIWFYAAQAAAACFATDADERTVRGISKTFVLGPWIYLAATAARGDESHSWAPIAFILFALFWVIESSVFGRDRSPGDVGP